MNRRKTVANFLFGLAFVVAGLLLAGDALGFFDFKEIRSVFPGWWALFIIVPCLISFLSNGIHFANALGFTIGAIFLVGEQIKLYYKDFSYGKLILPVVLIFAGVQILLSNRKIPAIKIPKTEKSSMVPNYTAIFGGYDRRFAGDKFGGANCTAVFGGVELDLRGAIIENDIVINATAIFGGIDIFMPDNVNVIIEGVPIFGGIENKVVNDQQANRPTVYIKASVIFAGLEIR